MREKFTFLSRRNLPALPAFIYGIKRTPMRSQTVSALLTLAPPVERGTFPTAGTGINASLLGTKKLKGETYPTYHGWLMYEYAADSGPGQANGQKITSFGGTWYVLNPTGDPVTSKSGGGGY